MEAEEAEAEVLLGLLFNNPHLKIVPGVTVWEGVSVALYQRKQQAIEKKNTCNKKAQSLHSSFTRDSKFP